MGLTDLMLHAGFLPEVGDPGRKALLDTLAKAGQMAAEKGVTLAFETGQETAKLLRRTLDELKSPNIKVNFDPANMLLYDMGDPIQAVEILGPDIRSVHVKDAKRTDRPRALGPGSPAWRGRSRYPPVHPDPQGRRLRRAIGRRARGRRPGRSDQGRQARPRPPSPMSERTGLSRRWEVAAGSDAGYLGPVVRDHQRQAIGEDRGDDAFDLEIRLAALMAFGLAMDAAQTPRPRSNLTRRANKPFPKVGELPKK